MRETGLRMTGAKTDGLMRGTSQLSREKDCICIIREIYATRSLGERKALGRIYMTFREAQAENTHIFIPQVRARDGYGCANSEPSLATIRNF